MAPSAAPPDTTGTTDRRGGPLGVLPLAAIFLGFVFVSILMNSLFAHQWSLYLDDWAMILEAVDTTDEEFWKLFNDMLQYQWEMRPLRAIEYLIKRVVFSFFGFTGLYHLMALSVAVTAFLLYLLFRTRFPEGISLLLGLLFVLSPLDTTVQWLSAAHYRFGLPLVILAMILTTRGHNLLPGLLLLSGFLLSELCPAIYLATPLLYWDPDKTLKNQDPDLYRIARKTFAVFIPVFSLYFIWRIFIAPLYMKDVRVHMVQSRGSLKTFFQYFERIFHGYIVVFLSHIAFMFRKISEHFISFILLWSALFFSSRKVLHKFPIKLPDQSIIKNQIKRLIIVGILSVPLACWLSIWAAPSRSLGIGSRFNYVLQIPYALIIAGCILFVFSKLYNNKDKIRNLLYLSLVISLIFSSFIITKIGYQLDYSKSASYQKEVMKQIDQINPSGDSLVILSAAWNPRQLAMIPLGDIERWKMSDNLKVAVIIDTFIKEVHENGDKQEILFKDGSNLLVPFNKIHKITVMHNPLL